MPGKRKASAPAPGRPARAQERLRACVAIERFWSRQGRWGKTASLVDRFFSRGPTIEHVKRISFEALVVFLRERPVIDATKACLQRVHLLSTFRHGSPPKMLAPENVNVRVFLAGFMIAFRPTHVFESMGTLEQALYDTARPLIAKFEEI